MVDVAMVLFSSATVLVAGRLAVMLLLPKVTLICRLSAPPSSSGRLAGAEAC
jgi:hypothetical protein